jgi:DNA invertase Pin-like site-specific DNA recombinase
VLAAATDKITPRHRDRHAYIYVRQSTPRQVQQHRESQANQYALVERAGALGWIPERIHVIDADLGQSGQDGQRPGFQEVVAEVSLGHVGIILSYEASRLARSNADWYTLLDLATVMGTLIADTDGVYDPRAYNDRLLLGLRGMFSEAELHLLHLRLEAGRMRQVERGSYRQQLPTGLVRLPAGRVVKDPDLGIQRAIGLVFARFRALGSCPKVLRALRDEGVLLPRRQTAGVHRGDLLWKAPTEGAIYEILRNPAYAGAFVFGRHGHEPAPHPGRGTRRVHRPMEEWVQVHQDTYPAYISWETFMANQAQLRDNASSFAQRARGAPRAGAALLAGLVVCGHCGRQMHVAYRSRPYYRCSALQKVYGRSYCLHLDGPPLDAVVVEAFFEAIAPAELSVLQTVLAAQRADHDRSAQQYTDQVKRAEYGARLAERQYQAVDPDNRLVASELERRWELALRALAEVREAAERFAHQPPEPELDPTLRVQLQELSTKLPELWRSGRLQPAHQKALLRSLIRRVILSRPAPARIDLRIVWVSGAVTPLTLAPPVYRTSEIRNYEDLVARVLALSQEGYPDREIADQLTAEGFSSARQLPISPGLVGKIRREHGQMSIREHFRSDEQMADAWTIHGLAQRLGVRRTWLYARIRNGTLPAHRHPVSGHYLIPNDPQVLASLAADRDAHRHT